MKRFLPLAIAAVVFLFAVLMMQPEATVSLAAAALDLPAGRILQPGDLQVIQLPMSLAPTGAIADPNALLGQRLRVERTAGDLLYPSHLGGEALVLQPDERAIAIRVTDSGGLAGLLKPGDHVGLTAILPDASGAGTFGKAVIGGLRVLYISPTFLAQDPPARPSSTVQGTPEANSGAFSTANSGTTVQRQESGTVVLAVPITARVVGYDFSAFGVANDSQLVYAVDLLPALDQAGSARLSLYLEPQAAQPFVSSGVYLPDLLRTPGPSPTPTETITPTPEYVAPAPSTPAPAQPTAVPTKKPKKP